ncbi:MAG: hypothetical protein LAQ30_12340 [Acidobacteriia bacterium]|nr:hypothetical protein [Terriglobia bacterium]
MSFPWLDMRIDEERDRRRRERETLERLPRALEELHKALTECVQVYARAFGPKSADIQLRDGNIHVTVREELDGEWRARAQVAVAPLAALPGFHVERGGEVFQIEIGMLTGEKLFYKCENQYLTPEQVTRRILDRALFPRLAE